MCSSDLEQTMREILINTRTPIDDPNIRREGGSRSFFVLENGEYEQEEGFWVIDEDTGEEGFVSIEDDGIFWVQDENDEETFFQKRHKRRTFRTRGTPRFVKRKGKGKTRSRGRFRSFRGRKARAKEKAIMQTVKSKKKKIFFMEKDAPDEKEKEK